MSKSQEPMIRLEPGGKAPILSYNVPDPTSYSGRNFIDLQLPTSYFKPKGSSAPAELLEPAPTAENLDLLRAQLRARGDTLSPALAALDAEEVHAMERAGKQLTVYRSMFGTLTHTFVDPTVGNEPIVDLMVFIMDPAEGAQLSGPHTGMTITVTGEVEAVGATPRVNLHVGGKVISAAVRNGTWSATTHTITQSGPLTLTAVASVTVSGKAVTARNSCTIHVTLAPANNPTPSPPPDTIPPVVTMTEPLANAQFKGSANGIDLWVKGTATDTGGSGMDRVEVAVDSGAFQTADPRAPGDWSEWSRAVTLAPGSHTITAKGFDKAGNISSIVSRSVTVTPPDTAGPSIQILSPATGANITGPFSGISVTVKGTAEDAGSGVNRVEVFLNGTHAAPTQGQPDQPGTWSAWTGSVMITTPGRHLIRARCYDNAGNSTDSNTVLVNITLAPEFASRVDRIILAESYRLSSYLGFYGAGKIVKTFSLLPGQKTKISIKTYTRGTTTAKDASSILDSFTQMSATNFEKTMGREQSDKRGYEESFNYQVGGEASASWGWGKASVSGEVSGSTNAAREEFAKNICNAVEKHAAEASAKREVQVNTAYEVKEEQGEETAIEREIENINVSRTLNFVFRQMLQEYITVLHLVDVRVGYYHVDTVTQSDGTSQDTYTYQEVALPQLDALLRDVIVESKRAEVRNAILHQLTHIFDYQDRHHTFVESKAFRDSDDRPVPGSDYLRVKKDYTSTYHDAATGTQIKVPGIIMAATRTVLRTDAVIVEALLGQGEALDDYSKGLQEEAVQNKELENSLMRARIEKERLALRLIEAKDAEAAKLFAKLFPKQPVQLVPYVLAESQEHGNGQPTEV